MKPNFDFQEKFGHIAFFMPDGELMYEQRSTGKMFLIPKKISESKIEMLMEKSVKENYDYIFPLVKNYEFILDSKVLY